MSTSYYYCREPVTKVKIASDGEDSRITVWVRGENVGSLWIEPNDIEAVARMFSDSDADDFHCPMRTHFGGAERGCVVTENVRGLDPNLCLIDEYGRPHTVREIRAMAGEGRKV